MRRWRQAAHLHRAAFFVAMTIPTSTISQLRELEAVRAEMLRRKIEVPRVAPRQKAVWPQCHVVGTDEMTPVPFHIGQQLAWDSERRIVAMVAGTQGGKTQFGPWWLAREIERCGNGDYLAVTAVYDLFKLRMLPALRWVFEDFLPTLERDDGLTYRGRYWAGDRVVEICDPKTGKFLAKRANDRMWARVILRSADAKGGLEAGTVKAAWLDEAGQDRFTITAWRGVKRRLAIHQGRALLTTTLYNLGWVKSEIIDEAEGGEVTLETLSNGAQIECTDNEESDIGLIQYDSIVNPSYPVEEFEEARRTTPGDEFKMFWRGQVAKLRFLIYDAFDDKMHKCPRFPIPDEWKRYLGLDYGGVNTVGIFYAEEPGTDRLFAYREYRAGGRTAAQHATELLKGEPGMPFCVGGSKSEGQWRLEFSQGGLPVISPKISNVNLGISHVYAQHRLGRIIYFDDLHGTLDEKGRYKRKRDKQGNVTDEIENKRLFHFMDAERYIIGYIRPGMLRKKVDSDKQEQLQSRSKWTAKTSPRWKRGR